MTGDHPILGEAVPLARSGETLFTGRISAQSQPWLTEHVVAGEVLVPSSVFAELAMQAAAQLGCEGVREIGVHSPLSLPKEEALQLQVSVLPPGDDGDREIQIHSRSEAAGEEASEWLLSAEGVLATEAPAAAVQCPGSWPPEYFEPIDAESLYDRLADAGFEYGPAFRTASKAWRREEDVLVEVSLTEAQAGEEKGFRLHPILIESVLNIAVAGGNEDDARFLPLLSSSWRDLRLASADVGSLRIWIEGQGERAVSFAAFDEVGAEVASGSVHGASVDPGKLLRAVSSRSLRRLEWSEVEADVAAGRVGEIAIVGSSAIEGLDEAKRFTDIPDLPSGDGAGASTVIVDLREASKESDGLPQAALAATERALQHAQAWIRANESGVGRLVLLTEGAVAVDEGESLDPAAAAVWGLVRCAQVEHPGSFQLIDLDRQSAPEGVLRQALSLDRAQQLAIRGGRLRVPHLVSGGSAEGAEEIPPIDPERTVLISGARGLGALLARHLVTVHGIRHLLLVSRSGAEGEGAERLLKELKDGGASVDLVACDVADRGQLEQAIGSVPAEHPIGAVVHCAREVDDGVLDSIDPQRLATAMRARAQGAWNLHELTRDMEGVRFLLSSSVVGLLGAVGQAGYAAANAFLDALAAQRCAAGLDATSLAWGGWAEAGGQDHGGGRGADDHLEQIGLAPMSSERLLGLFDLALRSPGPLLVPAQFDTAALRRQARTATLPSILSGVLGSLGDGEAASVDLMSMSPQEREAAALQLVRDKAAEILQLESVHRVESDRTLVELGFDSLGAVDLRSRLTQATGLSVPVFALANNPTIAAVAQRLLVAASVEDNGGETFNGGDGEAPEREVFMPMLAEAVERGREVEFVRTLTAAARSRPQLTELSAGYEPARAVRLAEGPERPSIVFVPSVLALSGPQEYARLTAGLKGKHTALSAPLLGFSQGEPLPGDIGLAARAQIEAVRGPIFDSDFVVAGHSSGGWLAHAVVTELEAEGIAPMALVLLDSPWPEAEAIERLMPTSIGGMLGAAKAGFPVDDDRLLAMAGYLEMLGERTPEETEAPTILLRARGGIAGGDGSDSGVFAPWRLPHASTEVEGNHFSMLLDYAEGTAAALLSALDDLRRADEADDDRGPSGGRES